MFVLSILLEKTFIFIYKIMWTAFKRIRIKHKDNIGFWIKGRSWYLTFLQENFHNYIFLLFGGFDVWFTLGIIIFIWSDRQHLTHSYGFNVLSFRKSVVCTVWKEIIRAHYILGCSLHSRRKSPSFLDPYLYNWYMIVTEHTFKNISFQS